MSAHYETLLPIGTGGMATVFVGRRHGDPRLVALKRAHKHVRSDAKLAESMKLEARLASRLHHTNVVTVLDVIDERDDLFLVLDYVEGCTLRTLLTKIERLEQWRPREVMRVLLDIAAGLHAAHQATDENGRILGLVHRDVSPSNIIVGVDGIARLADFGIAKALFESSDRTETGVLKGKSSYMAPEYVLYQHSNAASDLFSFAVVVWESLTNARLFKGATEIETLKNVVETEVRPMSSERPELAPFDAILAKALARSPSDRHASVEDFALELETVATTHHLVASRAEVGQLVERAVHTELAERRRALREEAETVVGNIPDLARFANELAAIPSTAPARPVPAADESTTSPRLGAGAEDPSTLSHGINLNVLQPLSAADREAQAAALANKVHTPPNKTTGRTSRRRVGEIVALITVSFLLGLALTGMAYQLRRTQPALPTAVAPPDEVEPTSAAPASAFVVTSATLGTETPELLDDGGDLSLPAPQLPDAAASARSRHRTTPTHLPKRGH